MTTENHTTPDEIDARDVVVGVIFLTGVLGTIFTGFNPLIGAFLAVALGLPLGFLVAGCVEMPKIVQDFKKPDA